MKTPELVDFVATHAGIDRKMAKKATEGFMAAVVEAAKRGEDAELFGFGKFRVKDVAARESHNPETNETKHLPATKTLNFVAAKQLKEALAS